MCSMLIEHKQECLKWRPPSTSPVCLYFLRERPSIYGQPESTNNPPPPVKNRPLLSQSSVQCLCVCLRGLLIACLLLQRRCSSQHGSSQPSSAPHLKHKVEIHFKTLPRSFEAPLFCDIIFVLRHLGFKCCRVCTYTSPGILLLDAVTFLPLPITTSWPWRRTKALLAFFFFHGSFKLKHVICQPKHHVAALACNLNKHPFNTFQTAE